MSQVSLPEWAEQLWKPSRYKALVGGRGGAKSRSVATALVLKGAQKPERILCAREVQKSIKDSVKRLLDDEIVRCGLQDFYESTETEIRGKNGTLFVFAGLKSNVASVKSLEGITICWVEEASSISQSSLETLVPTIRQEGSEIWFTWNPQKKTDPIDTLFNGDTPPPNSIIIRVNHDQNPWFPDVLRAEMEWDKQRDPDKYAHIWLGHYQKNSEARVFRNWSIETFEAPEGTTFRYGADWGFSVDPSVLVRCYAVGRKLYFDYEAYMVGCEIDKLPDLFDRVPDSRKWFITADSARPETISYMRKHGFPRINAAIKGQNSVQEGVEFLKSFDIVVHPRCTHLIDELTLYSYKIDPLTNEILPILEDKKNHVIDAARYALEGVRRAPKPVQATVIPTAHHFGLNRR